MNRSVRPDRVTVDEAIERGHRMITYPVVGIMLGPTGLGIYLALAQRVPPWIMAAGFVLGCGLGWLYWSVMITRWRLWAFGHVRNVHELKKRAVQEGLIQADGSLVEKTEIRTARDKEELAALRVKFDRADVFQDDVTVPRETVIGYAKGKNFFEMAVMLVCLGMGLYLFATADRYPAAIFLTIIGAYFGYREFRQATNDEPQIILSDKGIRTVSTPFYAWKDIRNEEAIREGSGKSTRFYLSYGHPEGLEKLQIDDYDTDQRALNKLLTLYRGRSENRNASR